MTFKGTVTAFAVLAAVSLGTAHANLLVNGSFEAVSAQASPFYLRSFASTPGWTQYANGVDLIHNNYTQGPAVLVDASDGVQFLDMNQAGKAGARRYAPAARRRSRPPWRRAPTACWP